MSYERVLLYKFIKFVFNVGNTVSLLFFLIFNWYYQGKWYTNSPFKTYFTLEDIVWNNESSLYKIFWQIKKKTWVFFFKHLPEVCSYNWYIICDWINQDNRVMKPLLLTCTWFKIFVFNSFWFYVFITIRYYFFYLLWIFQSYF